MAVLRASQLCYGAITGTAVTDVYTVPSGHRAVLRSVQLLEVSAAASNVQLRLGGFGSIALIPLAAYPAVGSSVQTPCWIVFNPGDVIQLARVSSGEITYLLSGSIYFV